MKVLIITQKIDKDDPGLGFFHRWVLAFFGAGVTTSVICLEKGKHSLPDSIPVFSLGKETRRSRLWYSIYFLYLIVALRKKYDSVFVHMNEEYILLGGIVFRLLGKKILFWRNHPHGSWRTRLAVALSHHVFCTSSFSFTAKFKKTILMPAGIDTVHFAPIHEIPHDFSLAFVGRISPVKKLELLIDAMEKLGEGVTMPPLFVYGESLSRDSAYEKSIKEKAKALVHQIKIHFLGAVSQRDLPRVYSQHSALVNMTPTGSFDKVILEAMACGMPVLLSNKSFENILPREHHGVLMFSEGDSGDLAEKIKKLVALPASLRLRIGQTLRDIVVRDQSLAALLKKLIPFF